MTLRPILFCAPVRTEYAELLLDQAGLDAEIRESPYLSGDAVIYMADPPPVPVCGYAPGMMEP